MLNDIPERLAEAHFSARQAVELAGYHAQIAVCLVFQGARTSGGYSTGSHGESFMKLLATKLHE